MCLPKSNDTDIDPVNNHSVVPYKSPLLSNCPNLLDSFSKFQQLSLRRLFNSITWLKYNISFQIEFQFAPNFHPSLLNGDMSLSLSFPVVKPISTVVPALKCRMAGCWNRIQLSLSHNVCSEHRKNFHPCIVDGCSNWFSTGRCDDRCHKCAQSNKVVIQCCSFDQCINGSLQGDTRCLFHIFPARIRKACSVVGCTDHAWDDRRTQTDDPARTRCTNHIHGFGQCRIDGCLAAAPLLNGVLLGLCHIHTSDLQLLEPTWSCKRCTSTDNSNIRPNSKLCRDCCREKAAAKVQHNLTPWSWIKPPARTITIFSRPIPLQIIDDTSSSASTSTSDNSSNSSSS